MTRGRTTATLLCVLGLVLAACGSDDEDAGSTTPAADATRPEVMRGEQIRVWFPIKKGFLGRTVGYVKAVNDANVAIRAGETLGIVGESGSGKTTLALAVMRLIESTGTVTFLGRDISRLDETWDDLAQAVKKMTRRNAR